MAKTREHLAPGVKIKELTPSDAATWRMTLRDMPVLEGTTKPHAGNAQTIVAAAVAATSPDLYDLPCRRAPADRFAHQGARLRSSLNERDATIDRCLGALYDAPPQTGDRRRGGLGGSSPNVARWLGDIRTFFRPVWSA